MSWTCHALGPGWPPSARRPCGHENDGRAAYALDQEVCKRCGTFRWASEMAGPQDGLALSAEPELYLRPGSGG